MFKRQPSLKERAATEYERGLPALDMLLGRAVVKHELAATAREMQYAAQELEVVKAVALAVRRLSADNFRGVGELEVDKSLAFGGKLRGKPVYRLPDAPDELFLTTAGRVISLDCDEYPIDSPQPCAHGLREHDATTLAGKLRVPEILERIRAFGVLE